jgi:serine/threonine-protein kinase
VLEAFDRGLRRVVAIKTAFSATLDENLEREGRALAAIANEGLPAVYALGHHEDRVFVVMERLRGLSLGRHIDERQARGVVFSVDEAVSLLLRVARTLAAVHDAGVAHRDIKPDNIMLAGERVVIVDFGLVTPEYRGEEDRGLEGSPAYMAPELIEHTVQRGEVFFADIYALGILAYEVLTYDTPFTADVLSLVLYAHVARAAPDVRDARPDVPAELAELIGRMLSKAPLDRPSVREICWALIQLQARLTNTGEARLPVLVVDDDVEHMLPLLKALLERCIPGTRIECVSDPVFAAQMLARERFGLVLLDLNMPTMSGLELLMYVRGGLATDLPDVVVVSAELDAVEPALLRSLGVVATVAKGPTLEEELTAVIRRFAGPKAGT